jgi:sodium/potassium-transporting ATPase subunit alpha
MLPELERDDAYRMATNMDIEDDNRTAIGQVKSVRRVPVSRSTTIASKATEMMDIEFLRQEINIDDHKIPIHDLLNRLLTDVNTGLTDQQADVLLTRDGPNQITTPLEPPTWVRFVKHMFGGFSMLMWLGAFLCFAHHSVESGIHREVSNENLVLGFALIVVIVITGIFSFIQETKENEMKEGIDKCFTNTCTVIRDGIENMIDSKELVVGDIVLLKIGEQVPADIRIFDARNFKVDNSSLTGESEPQWRSHNCTHENVLLTENIVFYSTFVVEGTARGIVVNTGDLTVVGRLSAYSLDHERRETPISREITKFIHLVTISACSLGVFFFVVAFLLGYYWIDAILFMIGIIVACVPEGILAIVTIALSVTAKRMSNKNCLVKNLEAVETLGATSVLITDKTGTLTSNKLTVAHVWFDNNIGEIDTSALENPAVSFETANHTWKNLARVAILCNKAEFDTENSANKPVLARPTIGDPTDSALLRCVESVEGDAAVFRQMHRTLLHIPFNPEAKIQVSVHECADYQTNGYLGCMIGSPDILLQRCATALINGQERRIDQDYKNAYYYAVTELAGLGETVVAIADARFPPQTFPPGFKFSGSQVNFPVNGYRLLGLMSMIDPPKATVPDAIAKVRAAGVKVIMVTGDHPATAAAIAKSVGIIGMENHPAAIGLTSTPTSQLPAGLVTGDDLENMTPELVEDILLRTDELVFARMKPEQKLQIVETCQRLGAVVTVTGDGINDAAAIRRADVGIAMAQTGAAYTIKCADIVLLDDDFASIVSGIEEGRLMFENLKKVLLYALSSNVPELAAFLISMVAQIPLPLGILAVLAIDLGTDLLPAVSLAFEEPETDLMKHQPRNPDTDPLLTEQLLFLSYGQLGLIQAASGFFTYFVIMSENGFKPDRLIGLRKAWESKAINDLRDSYGQEWTYDDRKTLEYMCQAGFLMSIVVVQWSVLLQTRSRRTSIFQRPMNNWVLNIALVFETLLAILIIYMPGSREGLQLAPISPLWWLPGLAFSFLLIGYEELRKAIARKHKGSWIDNETRF